MSRAEWSADTEPLDRRLGDPPAFDPPEEIDGTHWTLSTSWQRAQREDATVNPLNDAEWMVSMAESADHHRVVFVLDGATLRAECSCPGWQYRGFCPHVAKLWWRWVRGRLGVTHRQTGREYQSPPKWLRLGERDGPERELRGLTAAELDAYLTCELAHVGVREYARTTGRSPGTVGNLLGRARQKADDGVAYTDGGQR